MGRTAMTNKVIVLGVDGMDPRLTRKYVDKGLMPNVQKYLDRGAAREDLVLLGAVPTITPPMWTTLSTGAYPATHGITCFWSQHPTKIDTFQYANDSKKCQAEQLWNVTAEAGKKTLVFHWPGCSWPPTSDSENLHVIEGTNPSGVNFNVAKVEVGGIYVIDLKFDRTEDHVADHKEINGVGCVMSDVEVEKPKVSSVMASLSMPEPQPISMNPYEGECQNHGRTDFDFIAVPLKEAKNWAVQKEGDREFELMLNGGKTRRVGLFRKNEQGIYDTLEIYKSKKDTTPLVSLKENEHAPTVLDERFDKDDNKVATTNGYIPTRMAADGSSVTLWVGDALKTECDVLFSPHKLYHEVVDTAGYIPSFVLGGSIGSQPDLMDNFMVRTWQEYGDWQARAINSLIEQEDYEVVFSHYHNIDNFGHVFYDYHNTFGDMELDAVYEDLFEKVYRDTDRYLGDFLHLLDKGWTVIITADHGLLCKEEPGIAPGMGDGFVINTTIMRELGYTVMKRDENGEEIPEIDYSKTRAVASRGNHIYLNMKGRYEYGIVDESEKYELERQIIDDLFNYRDPVSGKRIINMAIRNQEGALLGLTGDKCGDILYWLEEGFNRCHGDSLSTLKGHADTSVSPLFIASGTGIKQGVYTDRVIRQVDVAPTVAALLGVRMPAQCEGAPVYQIFSEEF